MAVAYRPLRVSDKGAIAFSGQDKVPILIDEAGTAIADSWRIAEHLESRYSEQPLLFGGQAGRAFARFINWWTDRTLAPTAASMLMADVTECVDPEDATHLRTQMEKAFGKPLEDLRGGRDVHVKEFRRALDPARSSPSDTAIPVRSRPCPIRTISCSAFSNGRVLRAHSTWIGRGRPRVGGLARPHA